MSTAVSVGSSAIGTTMSSSVPGASCSGSTGARVIVRSPWTSRGEPQLEQKLLSGGLRCPQ